MTETDLKQFSSLLEITTDPVANMANTAAWLFQHIPNINWAGFYILKEEVLILGPFQGKPACVRIPLGKGVCGTAAKTGQTQIIANVHEFSGHIACDVCSKSEIVLPIFKNEVVWGVLDIDSPVLARFTQTDKLFLERILDIFIQKTAL